MERKEKILIVKLGAIGDVIHTLPALSALRKHYPDAFIAWLVGEKAAPLLEGHPLLDRLFILSGPTAKGFMSTLKEIRKISFTTTLDFQGLVKSGFWAKATGAGLRIGFALSACRESLNILFSNKKIEPPEKTHIIQINLSLLQGLGIQPSGTHFLFPENQTAEATVASQLKKMNLKEYILINPGAAWQTKRWPVGKFARLVERIKKDLGYPCLILWGPGEREIAEDINRRSRNEGIIAFPTSLMELLALVKNATLYVGGDTASLHMATAMGVAVVGIYGPTSPWRNGPFIDADLVAFRELECSHCYKRECRKMDCFEGINVETVFELVVERLKKSDAGAAGLPV